MVTVAYVSNEAAEKVVVGRGVRAQFTCLAAGIGLKDFNYQWFLNSDPVRGQRTKTLTISQVTEDNAGDYTCSVLNPYGGIGRSNKVVLVLEIYCNPVNVSYIGFTISWNETAVGVTVEAPCTGPGLSGQLIYKVK